MPGRHFGVCSFKIHISKEKIYLIQVLSGPRPAKTNVQMTAKHKVVLKTIHKFHCREKETTTKLDMHWIVHSGIPGPITFSQWYRTLEKAFIFSYIEKKYLCLHISARGNNLCIFCQAIHLWLILPVGWNWCQTNLLDKQSTQYPFSCHWLNNRKK